MTCPNCNGPLTTVDVQLVVKPHGVAEQCAEALVKVGKRVVMHERHGGMFLTRRKGPSKLSGEYCEGCGRLVVELARNSHTTEPGNIPGRVV